MAETKQAKKEQDDVGVLVNNGSVRRETNKKSMAECSCEHDIHSAYSCDM